MLTLVQYTQVPRYTPPTPLCAQVFTIYFRLHTQTIYYYLVILVIFHGRFNGVYSWYGMKLDPQCLFLASFCIKTDWSWHCTTRYLKKQKQKT